MNQLPKNFVVSPIRIELVKLSMNCYLVNSTLSLLLKLLDLGLAMLLHAHLLFVSL